MVLVLFRLSRQFALDSRDFDACIDPKSDVAAKWTSTKSKAAARLIAVKQVLEVDTNDRLGNKICC
jgi:hypothetical protein